MISFKLNGINVDVDKKDEQSLLHFLREEKHITSVKDGCSGEGICGACLVEINGKARLSCKTKMQKLNNAEIYTLDGIPENIRKIIAETFVNHAAVQCGFCSPGFIMRTHLLLKENHSPSIEQIRQAIKGHLCRCTGYKKIESAIIESAEILKQDNSISCLCKTGPVGTSSPKYESFETAIGERKFVNDLFFEDMLHGALLFSEHPRAKISKISTKDAENSPGVKRIFTAKDIPGDPIIGLIYKDWPLMIAEGKTTNYIGDVIAGVVADTNQQARDAVKKIKVTYEVNDPICDPLKAMQSNSPKVHQDKSNILDTCTLYRGEPEKELKQSKYTFKGIFKTQRIEHAFLETESSVAKCDAESITVYSSGQGVYEDRRQIAQILNIEEEKVRVILVPNGGGFGGKEDLTVQGHAALYSYILKKTVKVTLSREESIRMHPKRHPVEMNIQIGCDENGILTSMIMEAYGDTGAYASVGTKVMERIAGHATAGYFVPNINLKAHTVYTNNIPSGAMRGFGANQVAFAVESCIDELCKKGNFDRWEFRYKNALTEGLTTATGDPVKGVGIKACLEALKDYFYKYKYTGIATAIKNSGIGNGMIDFSDVIIEIVSENKIKLHHGWTEMGQGLHTIATQTLCQETGIDPSIVEVIVDTASEIKTGMTTSSRGTVLLGNAIIDACKLLKNDLQKSHIKKLVGKKYKGYWECNWTSKPSKGNIIAPTHYSYGYAAQLVILDDNGNIDKVVAAHDAGKIINPKLFEGQIEGAVHMGLGFALTENLPMVNGQLINNKLNDLKILRAHQTPDIKVIGIEVPDPVGPYGAKGIGEIGLIPTAAAVANAFYTYDHIRRYELPLSPIKKIENKS